MNLEELIRKRFLESESLVKRLSVFGGMPAVFSPEPPEENQEGWNGTTQYPMVYYSYDLQANEERQSAGILSVSLLCQNTTDVMPEVIEPLIKDCLRDVILTPEGGLPYCFTWARTDAFSIAESMTIGCEIRFDILAYPSQVTTDPDPVEATNQYLKRMYPECVVIGYDRLEEITEATAEKPVLYCRLLATDKDMETNMVTWMDGRMAVHILCPDSSVRMKMAAAISNEMSLDAEIIMLDDSPMFIKRTQANYKSDYLKDGQIFVTGHYGLLRYRAKHKSLNVANINYAEGGKTWQKKA
jgi:hypothetical protein